MVDNRYLLRATFFFSCLILSKSQNASDAGLLCVRSAAADGQASVTFMRQWSSGARAVYLTRWSQDTTLLGCDIYSDPSVVESYSALCKTQQQPQDQEVFTRFDVHAVLAPNAPCVLVPQKFSAPTRGDGTVRKTRRKRSSWLFPGTLWCGTGSRARRYDQLGMFERADVCCREHDHCQHSIPALSVSYGVFNHHFFTVSHCNCDQRFRQCLKRMNDSVSSMIGYTFFSVLQVPCFELQHVKRCTEMYWWGMCKRAKEAPYAVFQKSRPFDKSDSQHKHTHVGITSSEEQHLTKIKRVESERKSSKAKPRCEPRDPPRGDTFHRRRKTGKRCRTQKNLEEVSSLKESTESGAPTRSMPKKNGPSKRKTHGLKKESRAMKKSQRKDLNGLTSNSNLNASFTTPSTAAPLTQQLKFNVDSTITVKNTTKSLKSQKENRKPCQCEPRKTVVLQQQCKICSKQKIKTKTTVNKKVSTMEQKGHKSKSLISTTASPSQKASSSQWTPVTHGLLVSAKFRKTPAQENEAQQEQLDPHLRWSNSSQGLLEIFPDVTKQTQKSVDENSVLQKENHLKCESLKHLDDCKFKIFPLQGKHNLHNKDFKTVYHCNCTSRLAAQIKSFEQPSYLSSVLVDFVSHQCFTLPKQNKCPHEKRCSGGFIKAFHLLEALKKAEEKSKAEMGFSASERKRRIPVRLYKRCMRLQKEFEKMSELR